MMMTYQVSSSPHIRSRLTTGQVMYDVILALLPATVFGVWHFGSHALMIVLMSVVSATLTEFLFDWLTGKPNTVTDGSAVVTGLLLALSLPASVPLYIPYAGSLFAVLVVKCLFGGLGKNFMNPALGGRCFLLLSFSGVMTRYTVDGVSTATPLAELAAGNAVNVVQVITGHTSGVIGCSAFALLLGGLYLWVADGITWHIPVSVLLSFSAFMALCGQNVTPPVLLTHLAGGGVIMAAFFMATDPVTSPMTPPGQLLYGTCIGILSALFRVSGSSTDAVSYAVILSNLLVPAIDELVVTKPFAYRADAAERPVPFPFAQTAVVCCAAVVFTALCGVAFHATRDMVAENELADNLAVYQSVMPENAVSFRIHDAANDAIQELDGAIYGTAFGNVSIQEAVSARDDAGEEIAYIVTVTSHDGNDGDITVAAGILPDGTISGIAFTELNETPGIGMKAAEPAFINQFAGVQKDYLTLNEDVDGVSGATVTSTATVNAVNAALDFCLAHMRTG